MQVESADGRFVRWSVGSLLIFLSLAGTVAGLTLLFLGMRAVMEVGGACADGGPYVSAQPCPDGAPLAIIGGLWGGIVCLGLYVWQTMKHRVPSWWPLAWPALFISLGWNFLEYGLDPPGAGGLEWGWLICAVVFGLMGGVPLLLGGRLLAFTVLPFGTPPSPFGGARRTLAFTRAASGTYAPLYEAPNEAPAQTPDDDAELVYALERLAALRATGALTDAEFAAAKQRILGGQD